MYALLLLFHESGAHDGHVTVPIMETVGIVVAGDTCADGVHGDRLASPCIHAWAVDAARIRKRIGGR
jgi:hypothetical protein